MVTHKSVSLSDQIFEQLENDILSGKYKRGSTLTEQSISDSLGVSRTPVREALRRLEQEHMVESNGKGLVVLGITDNDAKVMFSIRKQIEGMAAAACARNITDDQIKDLKENLDMQEFFFGKKDMDKAKNLDTEFHRKIYEFSGSVVFYDTLTPLHKKLEKIRKTSFETEGRAQQSFSEHKEIYNAIATHNVEMAEIAMIHHVSNAQQSFIKRVELEDSADGND